MQITQFYETTIVDRESKAEGRFVILPRRAFSDESLLPPEEEQDEEGRWRFEELVHELAGDKPYLLSPSQIPSAVADCLARSTPDYSERLEKLPFSDIESFTRSQIEAHLAFAEILALAPVVPFEQSPLSLDSVASLITKASGVGLGAYAGFVVGGASPLIFVTVPAGMIVFGAAAGVANALEQGLRLRLLKLIKGEKTKSRSSRKA